MKCQNVAISHKLAFFDRLKRSGKDLTVEFNAEFDREIQSLIFAGSKATDQNISDNCEEYEHQNQIVAETSLI